MHTTDETNDRAALALLEELLPQAGSAVEKMWVLIRMGMCHRSLGERSRAEAAFRRSIEVARSPDGYVGLASVIPWDERRDEAEEALASALLMDPDHEEAQYALATLLRHRGEYRVSELLLTRALELDPGFMLAHAELGCVLLRGRSLCSRGDRGISRLDRAIGHLSRAIELEPSYGWSRHCMAIALWKRNDLDGADGQYRAALSLWPDDHLTVGAYGNFLSSTRRDIKLASTLIDQELHLEPSSATAHYHKAMVLLRRRRKKEAMLWFEAALSLGETRAKQFVEAG
jgi:tetratricopeptide (TPR) repeat protein